MNYRTVAVHQIICYTFHGPPPKASDENWIYFSVDHIDRKKENNSASNLRWGTLQLQMQNRTKRNSDEMVNPIKCVKNDGNESITGLVYLY